MFFCVMVILGINNHIVKGTGVLESDSVIRHVGF